MCFLMNLHIVLKKYVLFSKYFFCGREISLFSCEEMMVSSGEMMFSSEEMMFSSEEMMLFSEMLELSSEKLMGF